MNPQRNIRLGCIALLAVIILALGAIAASAQNVPATARQAASLPQFAARLAHPGAPHRTLAHRGAGACRPTQGYRRGSNLQPDDFSYSNGPINGTTDAWDINFGFVVADTFQANGGGTVTSFSFGAWLFPGDVLQSVEISITSSPFGGTTYYDGVVNFAQSGCVGNQYGYNVCTEAGTFNGPNLSAETYWVNLQNASVNTGNPVFWDENSGPSLAAENSVGTIPSEAFTINGGGNACMPESSGNFKVIHDFSGAGDGADPMGVAIDRAGNLYGPTGGGVGTVFKMMEAGSAWVLNTLYNFVGGDNGGSPDGVIVGNNGVLYGSASGGLQNCANGQPCGLIFGLRPSPNACRSVSCGWTENVLYRFAGSADAWDGGNLVSDRAGNLYGVSYSGGVQQQGAVFELSPSIGGWVETILYNFDGTSDGGGPTDIIVGNDGNLYGMAGLGGAYGDGVVFQLTQSANGWTEEVLYDIPTSIFGSSNPHSLLQDSSGSLFGTYEYPGCCASAVGLIFMLSPSNGTWVFTELHHGNENLDGDDVFSNMTLDAAGNIHGTEVAYSGCFNTVNYGYIFELLRTDNGWQFSTPIAWDHTYFPAGGSLAMDAQSNLYGTTNGCGGHDQGTVWELFATP